MKIVHFCLSSFYINNYNYQENALPRQNALDGHDVVIIASTQTFVGNEKLGYTIPGEYFNEDGIRVVRVPYRTILPRFIMSKIRAYSGVKELLERENPDIIMFHGSSSWEMLNIAEYKKKHPEIKFFVDSHSDVNNSAKTLISSYLLHKSFYRAIIRKSLPQIDKVFYLSYECDDFLKSMYNVPDTKLEFFPLGGTIFPERELQLKREKIRKSLELTNEHILCVHSGKMDKLKRTADIMKAFSKVESDKLRLVLIGSMTDKVKKDVLPLINADPRITFVGWKTADELMEYLCAADVYVQPGSQSATMQNAICCGCAIILYPHKSHEPYLKGNGYYVKTIEDMREAFKDIVNKPDKLQIMSENSMKIARELLDYKKLAARLYQ